MHRTHLPFLLVVLSFLAGACAHEEPLPPPDQLPPEATNVPAGGRFVLTGIRQPIVANITDQGIQGPQMNLGRFPNNDGSVAFRGTALGRDVNVTVRGTSADGVVGRSPFNLNVNPGPDGMVANGLLVGRPNTIAIGKARINGSVGSCGYDVRFQGQAYVGPRSCGGTPIQVGITLPPILNTWSDAEVATALSLLLAGP